MAAGLIVFIVIGLVLFGLMIAGTNGSKHDK